MKNSLNENIRNFRVARGINQIELGKILGVTKQCVSNWENDNVLPSVEMLVRLADYFNVSTDALLGRERNNAISLAGLTAEQTAHVSMLVKDLVEANKK
ncbi:MAG: helix-turn-helix transcriptional regulator [Clostridiales bacterium]|nr:helix-turn-helix transcriptional regulator [Clostridiales bacterium]